MRFLRRLAPRARPRMRHREALQKPCCTKPRAANRPYGDLVMVVAAEIGQGPHESPLAMLFGQSIGNIQAGLRTFCRKMQSSVITTQSGPCDAVGVAAARPVIDDVCGSGE